MRSFRASRYRPQRTRQMANSLTPGSRPGLGQPCLSRDAIRVTLELLGDIPHRPVEVSLAQCCREEPATPLEGAGNATVCSHRRDTLGEAHEITQPGFRAKTDHQVYMVCEYRIAQ